MRYLARPEVVRLLRVSEVDIIVITINSIRCVLILDLLYYLTTY
jgi:hypothetical protein